MSRPFLAVREWIRRISAQTPLRVKLMAALLILTTAAVVATGSAATAVLRSYLIDRVDGQLDRYTGLAAPYMTALGPRSATEAAPGTEVTGADAADATPNRSDTRRSENAAPISEPRLPTPYMLVTRDATGEPRRTEQPDNLDPGASPQLVPITLSQAYALQDEHFTVPARSGDHSGWRALVTPLPDGQGTITVALSLSEVDRTVRDLVRILFAVGLTVLTLISLLAYAIVRTSLRPLREVESTAEKIAAGDLTRRVPDHPKRTEVGRLSTSFNVMLTQIESAFAEREAAASAARASEQRMRRFVTDASHELRTPLTSIRGFAELYRQGAAGPDQVPVLMRRIEDEATRMGLLVEDLLLLARLDQQRPIAREPVDLVTIATDCVHAARAAHPDRTIEIGVLGGTRGETEDPPGVMGDDARLRQVVGNLLQNACTHTPTGTRVRVGVGADTAGGPDGSWAVVEVADDGPGLDPRECERIFERFYRTDTSRARSTGGSGLGLSIVAALVAAHGGTVTVSSGPGAGACFLVRLPAVAEEIDQALPVTADPPAPVARRRTRTTVEPGVPTR